MASEQLNKPPSLPPYPQMIMEAIDSLKPSEGASKSTISNYMESKYGEMPGSHSDLLLDHLKKLKESGELLFVNGNYHKPGPDAPLKRVRGRPPKTKEPMPPATVQSPPRPRGRPRKDPNAPPATKKSKPEGPPSVLKTGKPRGRPKKVQSEPQLMQSGVEA